MACAFFSLSGLVSHQFSIPARRRDGRHHRRAGAGAESDGVCATGGATGLFRPVYGVHPRDSRGVVGVFPAIGDGTGCDCFADDGRRAGTAGDSAFRGLHRPRTAADPDGRDHPAQSRRAQAGHHCQFCVAPGDSGLHERGGHHHRAVPARHVAGHPQGAQ